MRKDYVVMTVAFVLTCGMTAGMARTAVAQVTESPSVNSSSEADSAGPVAGHPFSARKSVRRVRVLPDGKVKFLRYESYPMQIARDSEGRIRMERVDDPPPECDQLSLKEPPKCPSVGILVIDPAHTGLTHWVEGEIGGRGAVVIRLSAELVEEAENLTSVVPEDSGPPIADGAILTRQKLGHRTIEGVSATGFRTTATIPAGLKGNPKPMVSIHEVWASPEMRLVVQIIDGDPHGDETISGLEKISTQPEVSLFEPPPSYEIQRREKQGDWKYGEVDVGSLDQWFVH